MLDHSEKDGKLLIKVRVVPRASRSEIAGEHEGALRVRLAAPPVNGAANDELISLLARTFDVPKSRIEIVGGQSSKLKLVSIQGGTKSDLARFARKR